MNWTPSHAIHDSYFDTDINYERLAELAKASRGIVATVQPLATDAAITTFRAGGNAVDAAVSAALTLGVVDSHNSGLGGGCFILIRIPDGRLIAIDGRETAPTAATRDMYLRNGTVNPQLSLTGPLASGVPSALLAYEKAVTEHGRLPLAQSLRAAAQIAKDGFAVDRIFAHNLARTVTVMRRSSAARAVYIKENGQPYGEGEILRQPDLATSYRSIAKHGTAWFYKHDFAKATAAWMSSHGGLITKDDFRRYRAKYRLPIITKYREYEIVGFLPPSSGGIHVGQILNILEHFNLTKLLKENSAAAYHVIAEAMKLAFAGGAYWLGDADFVPVPRGLLDKSYAAELAQQIDPEFATHVEGFGLPPDRATRVYGKHTTHIAAADAQGY